MPNIEMFLDPWKVVGSRTFRHYAECRNVKGSSADVLPLRATWEDGWTNFCFRGGTDRGRIGRGLVLGLAGGKKAREEMSLWVYFFHGLILGFLLASFARLAGRMGK